MTKKKARSTLMEMRNSSVALVQITRRKRWPRRERAAAIAAYVRQIDAMDIAIKSMTGGRP